MRAFAFLMVAALAGILFPAATPTAQAQVAINIGPAPECPYGYFDYSPYACAPASYYGPEWFNDGVFIGAGPWFHGAKDFHGHVDNHFSPKHGYKGAMPQRGEKAEPSRRVSAENFKGNEARDGRGHVVQEKK